MARGKWAIVIVAAYLVAAVAGGFTTGCRAGQAGGNAPQVVQAQKFELVDAKGKLLAVLGAAEGGGHGLLFVDQNEKLRASLGVTWDGEPGLNLVDKDENPRVSLELEGQNSWLMLLDEKGNPRATLYLEADGGSRFCLLDKGGITRADILSSGADGSSSVALFDKEGKVLWEAP